MRTVLHLLQAYPPLFSYKFTLLCFCTAFVVTLISIPHIIRLIKKFSLYDVPDNRKSHKEPIPTMGGIAIFIGLAAAMLLWFPFKNEPAQLAFFFSLTVLFILGIMDDRNDLSALYKLAVQIAIAALIAAAGIRIISFQGLFGVYELPLYSQYFFTIIAIVGVTNALNLMDGVDGLAGGISFMSLVTLGIFLSLSGDSTTALVAFALAGGILAFLYYNLNPALIFMGDTGSLVLGFVTAVLSVRLMQVNAVAINPALPQAPVFVLGIVLIPVFDALRVFSQRIWKGQSPMSPDKTHLHHLVIRGGFSHATAAAAICFFHALILLQAYLLKNIKQEISLAVLLALMLLIIFICSKSHRWKEWLGKLRISKDVME